MCSKFGGSEKLLSDNGTEFKNKLFEEVVNQLGVEYKVCTPPYRPQCNSKIEGFTAPSETEIIDTIHGRSVIH